MQEIVIQFDELIASNCLCFPRKSSDMIDAGGMMRIAIVDALLGAGGGHEGSIDGARALRDAGLVQAILDAGHTVHDRGDVPPSAARADHLEPSFRENGHLKSLHMVATSACAMDLAIMDIDSKDTPLVLGGDHGVSLGSLPALARKAEDEGRPFFVLWIDAHPDCHTPDTTESGHLHGTPLAYALGEPGFQPSFPAMEFPLSADRVLGLGIRSIDAAEANLISRLGLRMIEPAEMRREGISRVLEPFLQKVKRANGWLHVSFDADALDPSEAPGVGTPVKGGLCFDEAAEIMRLVAASQTLGSMELVEVNPHRDRDGKTAKTMAQLAGLAFGSLEATDHCRPQTAKPAASALSKVAFVSVDTMMGLIHARGVQRFLKDLAAHIEEDFLRWPSFQKSPRYAAHSPDGVIELMPTADSSSFAFKYVNGHPSNGLAGLQTVAAFGVLADVATGYPVLISEMTFLTALRTAAMSALAARHLARRHARSMAIIGNGAQSEFQALAFKALLGVDCLMLFDIDPEASRRCASNLARHGFRDIAIHRSAEDAVRDADIITTVTADKRCATILSDNMVGAGTHINAVGGDCPGKTELQKELLQRASIFVEHEPQTRIEGEIQQLPPVHPVTELWRVIAGQAPGRVSENEVTIFDSVGFAIEDFAALRYVHHCLIEDGGADLLDLIADPDETRDLFGMLMRAA
jgi:ornithine cyclodeaminase